MKRAEIIKYLEIIKDDNRPPANDPYLRGVRHGWQDASKLALDMLKGEL